MSAVLILIKLIAAHLVGDFILQSDKIPRAQTKYINKHSCKIADYV